jgi:hypothetical protein
MENPRPNRIVNTKDRTSRFHPTEGQSKALIETLDGQKYSVNHGTIRRLTPKKSKKSKRK